MRTRGQPMYNVMTVGLEEGENSISNDATFWRCIRWGKARDPRHGQS